MKIVSLPGLTKEEVEELLISYGTWMWDASIEKALTYRANWYRDDDGYWHVDVDDLPTQCAHKEVIDTGFGVVYCKHCHIKGHQQQGEVKWQTK